MIIIVFLAGKPVPSFIGTTIQKLLTKAVIPTKEETNNTHKAKPYGHYTFEYKTPFFNSLSFKEVLPSKKHVIRKKHTKKIEGINTWFRVRLRRLVRRTTCFSKKPKYHYTIIKWAIVKRDQQASYI